jgi:hypothetical protein
LRVLHEALARGLFDRRRRSQLPWDGAVRKYGGIHEHIFETVSAREDETEHDDDNNIMPPALENNASLAYSDI